MKELEIFNFNNMACVSLKNYNDALEEIERLNQALKDTKENADEIIVEQEKEIERLNKECDTYMKIATKRGNIIKELKKWFKGYHKSYASCKWYEEDYIEFIEHLEGELKENK